MVAIDSKQFGDEDYVFVNGGRIKTDLITENTIFCTKEVLTSDECAKYMGISKSYLYKLTMRGEIPHFKPLGKMCYFNRVEIEQWLQNNRVATSDEITESVKDNIRTSLNKLYLQQLIDVDKQKNITLKQKK